METPTNETAEVHGSSDVFALLEKRATIEQWIARLDAQRGSVSEKIIERVRADYERRLGETLQALGSHRSAVEDQLLSASDRLSIAEAKHIEAQERFEEGRLRNLIGELTDEEWSGEREALEQAVQTAADEASELKAEVERLSELMTQLNQEDGMALGLGDDGIMVGDASLSASAPPVSQVEESERTGDAASLVTAGSENGRDFGLQGSEAPGSFDLEDDPFLASIDRVLTDSTEGEDQPRPLPADDEPLEDTAPKPGLKCGECGYTNDLSAWFCGVCGADVG